MLGMPPPGYSPFTVNRQTSPTLATPGYQGATAQGFNPTASSYALPSNVPHPGLIPHAIPGAGSPGLIPTSQTPPVASLHSSNAANIVKALSGAR